MRYVIAGSSGFLGTALRARLARDGHDVTRLVRRPAVSASESSWDPYAGIVDADLIGSADVVVNLAGVSLVHWPWTASYRRKIVESRRSTTGTLADAIAAAPRRDGAVDLVLHRAERGGDPLAMERRQHDPA